MNKFKEIKGEIKFGCYKIIAELGIGGSSELLLALTENEKKVVVLKRLLPQHLENKLMVEQFKREIDIMKKLNHRNVCKYLNSGIIEGRYFLALEYLKGCTAKEFIKFLKRKKKKLPYYFIALIGLDICKALLHADRVFYKETILHLDISPQNIFITLNGITKILDFGISIFSKNKLRERAIAMGKLRYIPPEQIQGCNVDRRTDIYSLGISLYEILTFESVIRGENSTEIIENVLKGRFFLKNPQEGEETLSKVLIKAFQNLPEKRFQNLSSFSLSLKKTLRGRKIPEIRKEFKIFIDKELKDFIEKKEEKNFFEIPKSAEMKGEETTDKIAPQDEITIVNF